MDPIANARARLAQAAGLPGILDAAYDAFEAMLPVIHDQQDPASGAFVAFVMAAAYAANGRDAVGRAPSLPPAAPHPAPGDPPGPVSAREAATALAELSRLLARRLTDAAALATALADQAACADGAREADRLWSLLTRTAGP